MADKNLIAGAAALARSESMLGSALGAGLTQEATRIADDIIKKENERQAQVKNDMNLAAQFIGKMASTGTAAGQYRDILTQEGIKTKNRLNEIGFKINSQEIFTSLTATHDLVKSRNLKPLLLLSESALEVCNTRVLNMQCI